MVYRHVSLDPEDKVVVLLHSSFINLKMVTTSFSNILVEDDWRTYKLLATVVEMLTR